MNFVALLDSGANQTVVGKDSLFLLDLVKFKVDKDASPHLTTADCAVQSVSGFIYIHITVGCQCKVIKALLVPSLRRSIILGVDFCKKFSLDVNLKYFEYYTNNTIVDTINAVKTKKFTNNGFINLSVEQQKISRYHNP